MVSPWPDHWVAVWAKMDQRENGELIGPPVPHSRAHPRRSPHISPPRSQRTLRLSLHPPLLLLGIAPAIRGSMCDLVLIIVNEPDRVLNGRRHSGWLLSEPSRF